MAKHFQFFMKKVTECGIPSSEELDLTHKDLREVTCQKCKNSKVYQEMLRIWDAGYNTGYCDGSVKP